MCKTFCNYRRFPDKQCQWYICDTYSSPEAENMGIKAALYTRPGSPGSSADKESTCNAGDLGSISGSGRRPGGGHGNPLQHSCLRIRRDRGDCWAAVHGVAKNWTQTKQLSTCVLDLPLPFASVSLYTNPCILI